MDETYRAELDALLKRHAIQAGCAWAGAETGSEIKPNVAGIRAEIARNHYLSDNSEWNKLADSIITQISIRTGMVVNNGCKNDEIHRSQQGPVNYSEIKDMTLRTHKAVLMIAAHQFELDVKRPAAERWDEAAWQSFIASTVDNVSKTFRTPPEAPFMPLPAPGHGRNPYR